MTVTDEKVFYNLGYGALLWHGDEMSMVCVRHIIYIIHIGTF